MGRDASQLNDLTHPCPPITLNLDHLVLCYCLFYDKDYSLKLSTNVCEGTFSGILGNLITKTFLGKSPQTPLLPFWH